MVLWVSCSQLPTMVCSEIGLLQPVAPPAAPAAAAAAAAAAVVNAAAAAAVVEVEDVCFSHVVLDCLLL